MTFIFALIVFLLASFGSAAPINSMAANSTVTSTPDAAANQHPMDPKLIVAIVLGTFFGTITVLFVCYFGRSCVHEFSDQYHALSEGVMKILREGSMGLKTPQRMSRDSNDVELDGVVTAQATGHPPMMNRPEAEAQLENQSAADEGPRRKPWPLWFRILISLLCGLPCAASILFTMCYTICLRVILTFCIYDPCFRSRRHNED